MKQTTAYSIKRTSVTAALQRSKCFKKASMLEPWSIGFGRRLMSRRSWVQIPAPYRYWMDIFNIYFLAQIVMFVWKAKINEQQAHFFKESTDEKLIVWHTLFTRPHQKTIFHPHRWRCLFTFYLVLPSAGLQYVISSVSVLMGASKTLNGLEFSNDECLKENRWYG